MVTHLRWLALLLSSACGAHSAAASSELQPVMPTTPTTPSEPNSKPEAKAAKPPDPRELAGQAHFSDLVRLAQELDASNSAHSESGCLLRGTEPLHFEAD